MPLLDKEFRYYIDHQDELVAKYNGKHIVIKNNEVIGAYDSDAEAYFTTKKTHPLGTFLIQHCFPGRESYSARL